MIKNLRKLRTKAGLSQGKLAKIVGVSQQSINKYENHDVEPDISTLVKLAETFNVSVDYLIGHSSIPNIIEPVTEFDLNDDEISVIKSYRMLTSDEKYSIFLVIKNYLKMK
ncbi:MAG: helix-turn-helix domain-containing protein [Lentihominibacter sp.]